MIQLAHILSFWVQAGQAVPPHGNFGRLGIIKNRRADSLEPRFYRAVFAVELFVTVCRAYSRVKLQLCAVRQIRRADGKAVNEMPEAAKVILMQMGQKQEINV